jgi:uncharacterized membrane protein
MLPFSATAAYVFVLFICYGFIGFIVEGAFVWTEKKLGLPHCPSRKFLKILPLRPIYGFGALLLLGAGQIFLLPGDGILITYLLSFAVLTVLELVTGKLLKLVYGENPLWKYRPDSSLFPFDEQICLENSLLFGLGGVVIIYLLQPFLNHLLLGHDLRFVALILLILCGLDLGRTVIDDDKLSKRLEQLGRFS